MCIRDSITSVRISYSGSRPAEEVGFAIDNIQTLLTTPGGEGIIVENNASPTILNNILSNLGIALTIDDTSASSVLGGFLFQNNLLDSENDVLGENASVLETGEPLFVDPQAGNFYLDTGSLAIDSAIRSLEDRPELRVVRDPLGIAPSPILAPEVDVNGVFRADDPSVDTPPGLGEMVFIDRGANDRTDFDGPTAELTAPADGDSDSFAHSGSGLSEFIIQLNDNSVGVDDNSVDVTKILSFERGGRALTKGSDFSFQYDATNNQIVLNAGPGIWLSGEYHLVLDNSAETGIRDLANNSLQANQLAGTVEFTIQVGGGTDFGDAPDPPFETFLPSGARHRIAEGYFLGFGVDADGDGEPSANANRDALDDGVSFDTVLLVGNTAQVTVRASGDGFLDAWIGGAQIFASEPLVEGLNPLTFTVPTGIGSTGGESFARFRFSSVGGLGPAGSAPVSYTHLTLPTKA